MTWKPINKQIRINAPAAKVWHTLFDPEMYKQWAKEFAEGSYFINSENLAVGSKTIFTDTTRMYGMIAKVSINEPNRKIQFTFNGELKDGQEEYDADKVMPGLIGKTETYILTETDDQVLLDIEAGMDEQWYDDMIVAWDKALLAIKNLSETQ